MRIYLNGRAMAANDGTTVAAALLSAGETCFHQSATCEPRAPLCGMGVCQECRVMIDGVRHVRSCMVFCREGMRVCTGDA